MAWGDTEVMPQSGYGDGFCYGYGDAYGFCYGFCYGYGDGDGEGYGYDFTGGVVILEEIHDGLG